METVRVSSHGIRTLRSVLLNIEQMPSVAFHVVCDEGREDRTRGSRLYPSNTVLVHEMSGIAPEIVVGECLWNADRRGVLTHRGEVAIAT